MEKQFYFERRKAIIFDLDGTIVNLNVNWKKLKNILSDRFNNLYGTKYDFQRITDCLDKVLEKGNQMELTKFLNIIEEYELQNIDRNENIEETLFFINNLKVFKVQDGTKLAVFSLNMKKTIINSLKNAKIYDKFDYIVSREDVQRWKPHPDGLIKIQKQSKLNSEDLLYFGDSESDINAGKNAGVDAFFIDDLIAHVKETRNKLM